MQQRFSDPDISETDGNINSALGDIIATLVDMFKLIKKRFFLFLLIILVFTGGALGYSLYCYEPLYETSATFSITPLIAGDSGSGLSVYKFNYVSSFAEQMSKTFPYIVESGSLRDVIKNEIGKGYINGTVKANPVGGSNVFDVRVQSSSPSDAQEILDAVIVNFPKISDYIIGDTRLNLIHKTETPTEPINSADNIRHTLYGTAFGAALAFALFFLMALRRETVKSKNDIKTKLNSKCICEVPHIDRKRTSSSSKDVLPSIGAKAPAFSESLRILKKRLTALLSPEEKIIAVTSTTSKEGRSTVCLNLARTLANSGAKVAYLDMDYMNGKIRQSLPVEGQPEEGIADFCKHGVPFEKVVFKYKKDLHVFFAGSEYVRYGNDSKVNEFFARLREEYDYIVADLPACGVAAEVSTIADLCDVLLFVVKSDSTAVGDIKNSLKYILYSSARFLGFVLNNGSSYSGGYGYYGKYKSYGRSYIRGRRDSDGYGIDSVQRQ